MATEQQRKRFWADTGSSSAVFDDDEVDDIFTEAAEEYSDAGVIKAHARVIGIQRLLASSAKLTSYRQNASSENLSDVFKHLQELLKLWQGKLAAAKATASSSGAARFGGLRRKPKRIREYPDG